MLQEHLWNCIITANLVLSVEYMLDAVDNTSTTPNIHLFLLQCRMSITALPHFPRSDNTSLVCSLPLHPSQLGALPMSFITLRATITTSSWERASATVGMPPKTGYGIFSSLDKIPCEVSKPENSTGYKVVYSIPHLKIVNDYDVLATLLVAPHHHTDLPLRISSVDVHVYFSKPVLRYLSRSEHQQEPYIVPFDLYSNIPYSTVPLPVRSYSQ